MGRVWTPQYVPGATRITCSICGFPRRFGDDDIVLSPDKLFRCEKCNEKTTYEVDQELAAFRQRREEQDIPIGLRPPWESEQSLLEIAQERQAALIPGWTPTTTLNETFDTLPGGVGSLWTTRLVGSGAISAPESGVARFDTVTGGSVAEAWATGTSLSPPATGRMYCLIRFKYLSAVDGGTSVRAGAARISGTPAEFAMCGVRGATSTAFFVAPWTVTPKVVTTSVEVDDELHYAEVWWNADGYVRGTIDMQPTTQALGASTTFVGASIFPYLSAFDGVSTSGPEQLDVYGGVWMT